MQITKKFIACQNELFCIKCFSPHHFSLVHLLVSSCFEDIFSFPNLYCYSSPFVHSFKMMQSKMTFAIVVSIAFCISLNFITVCGMPQDIAENQQNQINVTVPPFVDAIMPGTGVILNSILNSYKCSEEAGCHKVNSTSDT